MSLPLWDPIQMPPDYTLVDINSLEPEELRQSMQSQALALWLAEIGEEPGASIVREWSHDEGMFAVYDAANTIVGITIISDVV